MDELNKLEIRRSEIRQRMNEISGLDDLSEGVIAEEEKLRDEISETRNPSQGREDRRRPGRQASKRGLSRMMTRKARSWPSLGKA